MPIPELDQEWTEEAIREVYDHNDRYWTVQRTLDQDFLDLYDDKHKVPIPSTMGGDQIVRLEPERVHSGESARIVNRMKAMYPQLADIGLRWQGEGPGTVGEADRYEEALNSIMDLLNPTGDAPFASEREQIILLGRAAHIILPGEEYFWDFPWMGEEEDEGKEEAAREEAWAEKYGDWRAKAPLPLIWRDLPRPIDLPSHLRPGQRSRPLHAGFVVLGSVPHVLRGGTGGHRERR